MILEPIERRAWPRGYWERLSELHLDRESEAMMPVLEEPDLDDP